MKTTNLFRVVAMLVLAIAGALSASAGGALTVSRTAMTSDGNLNYKHFEVQATTAGTHYAEFWLNSGELEDGTYTEHSVYVNGVFAGKITPAKTGWQAISLDNGGVLSLKAGSNVISIATEMPELPDVETVSIATSKENAQIDHSAYDNYITNAKLGIALEPASAYEAPMAFAAAKAPGLIVKGAVPLRYTFYKYVYFNQGDRITISTESDTPHVTEVMMYGEYTLNNPPVIVSPEDNIANALAGGSLSTLSTNVDADPVPLPDKLWAVTRFNSETTHENNWIDHSLYTDGDGESTFLEVTSAPESAYYLIRVRTKENDQAGTARIVIRGKKTYRSEPITCSKVTCELPADSNEYLTMTASANQEDDDPMLFLHADNDSIVNMEDDCLSKWMEQYGIGKHDAVLTQKNITPIKAVSVCNYSTLQPVSSCTIISGIVVNESSSKSRGNDIVMSKTAERGANIEISASEQIDNVSVYGIYGELIGSAKVSGNEVSVPVSSLGISKSGVYIVNVQTTSGSESGRLFVK